MCSKIFEKSFLIRRFHRKNLYLTISKETVRVEGILRMQCTPACHLSIENTKSAELHNATDAAMRNRIVGRRYTSKHYTLVTCSNKMRDRSEASLFNPAFASRFSGCLSRWNCWKLVRRTYRFDLSLPVAMKVCLCIICLIDPYVLALNTMEGKR